MKCPLQKHCHGNMVRHLDAANEQRERVEAEAADEIAALRETVNLLRFQLEAAATFTRRNMTERAKRIASGYAATDSRVPDFPCRKCGHHERVLFSGGYDPQAMKKRYYRCSKFDHRVSGRLGSCPNHTARKQLQDAAQ